MSSQILLRLLILSILVHSTWGIVCYLCETKSNATDDDIEWIPKPKKVEGNSTNKEGGEGGRGRAGRAGRVRRDDPTDKPAPPPVGEATDGPAMYTPVGWYNMSLNGSVGSGNGGPFQVKDPECLPEDKKAHEELWAEVECEPQERACFVLKGTIVEIGVGMYSRHTITKRGCYNTQTGGSGYLSLGNSTFEKDKRITVDSNTKSGIENGRLTGSAKLTVCDDLNGGKMLCNRGGRSGISFTMAVAVFIILSSILGLQLHLHPVM